MPPFAIDSSDAFAAASAAAFAAAAAGCRLAFRRRAFARCRRDAAYADAALLYVPLRRLIYLMPFSLDFLSFAAADFASRLHFAAFDFFRA
jgi:hypothetical protein